MQVFGCHEAIYRRCPACEFIHVANPFWLEDAYNNPLASSDVGGVDRNLHFARILRAVIEGFFDHRSQFVDYGGGVGLLTRLMRDAGYDFFWHDSHCQNVYAEGFQADLNAVGRYELLTAMEVFEHLKDPLPAVEKMTAIAENLLIMTHLVRDPPPRPGEWWYYGPDHGQHVSFFSSKTFMLIAQKYRLYYVTNGLNLHLLSARPVSFVKFKFLTWYPLAVLYGAFWRRTSLLPEDFNTKRRNS